MLFRSPLTYVANTVILTHQSSRFVDNSPSNSSFTFRGTPTIQRFSPFAPAVVTPASYSVNFNGSTDYFTIPNNSSFNFGTGDFTIECWVYTNSSATQRIVSYATGSSLPYEFLLVNSGSNVYVDFYDGTTDNTTGTNYVTQNQWVHVAVTRAGTSLKIFINGIISGTATNSINLTSSGSLYIGRYAPSATQYFSGYIDDLRITKGLARYTANFTPPTSALSTF